MTNILALYTIKKTSEKTNVSHQPRARPFLHTHRTPRHRPPRHLRRTRPRPGPPKNIRIGIAIHQLCQKCRRVRVLGLPAVSA